jgi:hypothetical protein
MEKVMILSTPSEIAEGLKIFMADYQKPNMETSFKDEKMSVEEASKFIEIGYATLCKRIKEGKFQVHGNGRTRFVLKSELVRDFKNSK